MAGSQQDEVMLFNSLAADAPTALTAVSAPSSPRAEIVVPAASESSESSETEERAGKRRRVIPDLEAVLVEAEEECCIIEPVAMIAAAAAGDVGTVGRTADEQSSINIDGFTDKQQSKETNSFAASLDHIRLDAAAGSPSAEGSDLAKPAKKRRAQACRTCGLMLSSASNRLRHERSKHQPTMSSGPPPPQQQQQQKHSSPAAFMDAQPRRSYLHGAAASAASHGAATSPPSSGPQTYRSASKRSSTAMMNASSSPMIPLARSQSLSEAEAESEEDDWELAQFIAAGSAGSDLSADPSAEDSEERPMSTSSGDDIKSDDAPPHDAQPSSSTPSSESDSNDSMGMNFPGNPLLYNDEEMQAGCQSFLVWLSEPPLTPCEFLVKGRSRLKSLAALIPIKNSLRFIYQLLAAKEETRSASVDLRVWTSLTTSQALYSALCDRGVGSGRLHGIFLLVKKILVYLSGRDSIARRQYLPPNLIESYAFVTGICSENGLRRKSEARNKRLLGIQATKQLLLDHRGTHSAQPFTIPATWTTNKEVQQSPAPRIASSSSAAAVMPAAGPSNNEMSTSELQLVTKKCLATLQELMHTPLSSNLTKAGVQDRWFMCLVVTATLALGLAPRSMVLTQLRIGSSFTRGEDGRYFVKLLAEQSKNNRPTFFALPLELTPVYDHYLEQVRPRLLVQATAGSRSAAGGDTAQSQHLFTKRNSDAARTDFNSCVNLVTQEFLGRPLNTHSFRSAITTAYYSKTCGSEHDLILLSQIMGHDVGTARAYYYKPKFSAAAVEANEKMKNFLLQSDA